ncbi:MAG: type III-A CRISPR-associated protein Csm2 [Syntrophobacteraceae bacterium]|nr:type III-A CRISPR-associated protein Csm2 [Syntrophobacteraceae bacterium]
MAYGGRNPGQEAGGFDVQEADLKSIVIGGDAVKLNDVASKLGKYCVTGGEKEKVSASQIRGILDHLQRMYKFDPNELQLLRPKLAYAAGRHGGKVNDLQKVADKAITMVEADKKRFENFRNFFEAIVAYHRFHGGK